MTQTQALAIMDAGHSVILTGPAGSGKTHVLNTFIRQARATGKSVAVTASTGLAGTHLGGTTIHAWSGIGVADELHVRTIADMTKSRTDQIRQADILIIDEVSMLHDFRLDMVEQVCRKIRMIDEPFGGLQLILSGDFFQLPPVNRADSKHGDFIVYGRAWEMLDPVVCYLDEQHRQADDMLLEILTALRDNDVRHRHVQALMDRQIPRTPFDKPITELHTRNIDVDAVNAKKLADVSGEIHSYEMTTSGRKQAVLALKKSCLAVENLQLKVGAFVMFIKNASDKKYVNGTLGTVVSFDKDTGYPIIETVRGKSILAIPDTWEMRDGEKKIASVSQIPLRLAWAITVHKSQGMTLDAAYIDLRSAFVPGMGYVALSRVRSLDTLFLAGLNRMALTMHEQSYEIDRLLRRKSSQDIQRFAHLEETYVKSAMKEADEHQVKDRKSWQEKLQKMRENHPNAYKPWTKLEDKTLLEAWSQEASIKKLAQVLGRHEGSIRARLKKHFGDDIFQN